MADAHLDNAYNALISGLHPFSPFDKFKKLSPDGEANFYSVCFENLKKANVRLICATLYVDPKNENMHLTALNQLLYYHALEEKGFLKIADSASSLKHIIEDTDDIATVILMEGANPVRSVDELDFWYALNLRILALCWNDNCYAGCSWNPGFSLTNQGRNLLLRMDELGMILDISHLSDSAVFEALSIFKGAVMASHSNARNACNCLSAMPDPSWGRGIRQKDEGTVSLCYRSLPDDIIKAVTQRHGFIGGVLFSPFILDTADRENIKNQVCLKDYVRHFEYIKRLSGSSSFSGIGSDFDGGLGVLDIPSELLGYQDLPLIYDALICSGFSHEEAIGITGRNLYDFLLRFLP